MAFLLWWAERDRMESARRKQSEEADERAMLLPESKSLPDLLADWGRLYELQTQPKPTLAPHIDMGLLDVTDELNKRGFSVGTINYAERERHLAVNESLRAQSRRERSDT